MQRLFVIDRQIQKIVFNENILAEFPTVCNTEKRLLADSASLAILSCWTSTRKLLYTNNTRHDSNCYYYTHWKGLTQRAPSN